MINIIRADMYRILRGKALYITFAVLFALNLLVVITMAEGTIGVNLEQVEEQFVQSAEVVLYDGMNIVAVLMSSMDNLIYFLIPLFILVASPIFSHGTVKNELSSGMPRTKLYFSKLILSSILCVVMVAFYIATGMLIATILRGFGGPIPDGYWFDILKTCSAQLVMLLALNCIGIFLVFTTKRTAIVNAVYIAGCLVPSIVVMLLANKNPDFIKLFDFDIAGNIKKLAYMDSLESQDFVKAFGTAAFYIVASITAGVMLFKRAEIK